MNKADLVTICERQNTARWWWPCCTPMTVPELKAALAKKGVCECGCETLFNGVKIKFRRDAKGEWASVSKDCT